MSDQTDYDALATRLVDPYQPVRSAGEVRTGDEAAAVGRAWLLREYGSAAAAKARPDQTPG